MSTRALAGLLDDTRSGPCSSSARGLVDDRRGAVLLIAVFMSSFLVACLWYIIGIGDAAVYRQYLQDGADSVAFGSAVYHARGMNILALINLVMAAVLAVLVAFKMAQVLLIAANVLSCACAAAAVGFNPVCDAACTLTGAAENPMDKLVSAVEKIVNQVLKALHMASNAVAYGMPWVAEGKAIMVASDYKPTVQGGAMMSISLVPGVVEGALGGFKKGASNNRMGLPVEDDDFKVLCKKAGKLAGEMMFAPFDFLGMPMVSGTVGSFAGSVMGSLASTFPGYFCGDSGGGGGSYSASTGGYGVDGKGTTAQQYCDAENQKNIDANKKIEDENKVRATKGEMALPLNPPFDVKKCVADTTKDKKMVDAGSPMSDTGGKSSKKVFDSAVNGDIYFAVWAFTWGDLGKQSDAGKGVNIGAWNKAKVSAPEVWSKIALAKAEFYYEPKSNNAAWSDIKDDAMWNMRWRARLRRVRLPSFSAGNWLVGKISSKIPVAVGDLFSSDLDKVAGLVDDAVGKVLGGLRSGTIAH
jgi:hypothetical protein